ncbi:MAG: T9SS type A sorting domain-containing protein, partial [Flavobacteriaceae bacterium]|nr:T9SS type A sorting domain-containing protein [Flavobacteriaceae bacterium]
NDPYDTEYNNSNRTLGFYAIQHEKKFTILSQDELWRNEELIPLGIDVSAIENYEIAIDKEFINPNYAIELKDGFTGLVTNLRTSSYKFNVAQKGEDNQRFTIQLKNLNPVDLAEMVFDLNIYFDGDILKSSINPAIDAISLTIYDFKGTKLRHYTYDSQIQTADLSEGIYMVSILLENGRSVHKKLVKINS